MPFTPLLVAWIVSVPGAPTLPLDLAVSDTTESTPYTTHQDDHRGQNTAGIFTKPRTRPTLRLTADQLAAIEWWRAWGGQDRTQVEMLSVAADLRLRWQQEGRPTGALRAQLERVELGLLMARAKGTRDLALVAQAIYDLETEGVIDPLDWVDDAGDWNKSTLRSVEDLLYCRRNNCFCFVNFCAWLSGDQPVGDGGVPLISHGAWTHPTSPGAALLAGPPTPGDVVVGQHKMAINNNSYGFQHTGIVVADGEVIHLGSRDLRKDPVGSVFAALTRATYVGPFDWAGHVEADLSR